LTLGTPLVDAYRLDAFSQLFGDKDDERERPGSFQSCSLRNRLDYILLSPELAAKVTDGGVLRKGLWGATEEQDQAQAVDHLPGDQRIPARRIRPRRGFGSI
jgi:hypothetical protein